MGLEEERKWCDNKVFKDVTDYSHTFEPIPVIIVIGYSLHNLFYAVKIGRLEIPGVKVVASKVHMSSPLW